MSTSKSLVEKRVSVQLKAGLDKLLHLNNEDMLSSAIDRQNKQDFEQQKAKYQCKVLLLGAGDSGKSTIVKQLKVLHGGGFEEGELRHWAIKIHENMSSSMATIITLAKREEALKDDEQKSLAANILKAVSNQAPLENLRADISKLFLNTSVREIMTNRASETGLPENMNYFFENLERIASPTYHPNTEDVLKARQKTTIITETHFKIDERSFVFIDVGGQQQFRYQWTRFFDDCKAIIFVASISCFDQVLEENEAINRFEDTMDLFEQVCNNEILRAVAIILFLNKVDLLTEKIVRNPGIVKKRFPEFIDYRDDTDVKVVRNFLRDKLLKRSCFEDRTIISHFTTSTDTTLMKTVISETTKIIINASLKSSGLL